MTIERLERVMKWVKWKNPGERNPSYDQIVMAIMHECGIDPKTIKNNLKALKKLGFIKIYNKRRYTIIDQDTGNY